jgi:hypothetical protein
LSPELSYSDDELPDLWHARKDLAFRFSAELARAWARSTDRTCRRLPAASL